MSVPRRDSGDLEGQGSSDRNFASSRESSYIASCRIAMQWRAGIAADSSIAVKSSDTNSYLHVVPPVCAASASYRESATVSSSSSSRAFGGIALKRNIRSPSSRQRAPFANFRRSSVDVADAESGVLTGSSVHERLPKSYTTADDQGASKKPGASFPPWTDRSSRSISFRSGQGGIAGTPNRRSVMDTEAQQQVAGSSGRNAGAGSSAYDLHGANS